MATQGSVGEFYTTVKQWATYVEQLGFAKSDVQNECNSDQHSWPNHVQSHLELAQQNVQIHRLLGNVNICKSLFHCDHEIFG